jgi:hypothetical protein
MRLAAYLCLPDGTYRDLESTFEAGGFQEAAQQALDLHPDERIAFKVHGTFAAVQPWNAAGFEIDTTNRGLRRDGQARGSGLGSAGRFTDNGSNTDDRVPWLHDQHG